MTQTTVDPAEVAKFEAMAAEWWDPNGKFKPLHMLNPCRLDYITSQIAAEFDRDLTQPLPFKGLRILDIGCGGGLLSEPMARLGAAVVGATVTAASSVTRPFTVPSMMTGSYNWLQPALQYGGRSDKFDYFAVGQYVSNGIGIENPTPSTAPLHDAPICLEHEGNRMVRDGRWKLVGFFREPWELYDLEADRAEARKLLEYLVSDEAQKIYAQVDYEYPVKPGIAPDAIIAGFGALKPDTIALTEIAKHRKAASLLAERVGFDN